MAYDQDRGVSDAIVYSWAEDASSETPPNALQRQSGELTGDIEQKQKEQSEEKQGPAANDAS